MSIYFIDYENVGAAGLQGISRLKEGDRVIIFHGMNSGSISFDLHLQIFASAATVEYIRTGKSAKNYLDFQLSTYLGYQIAASNASEYVIVSRDAGFDSVIDFWMRRGGRMTFRRQASVGIAPPSTMNVVKAAPQPAESVVTELVPEISVLPEPVEDEATETAIEPAVQAEPVKPKRTYNRKTKPAEPADTKKRTARSAVKSTVKPAEIPVKSEPKAETAEPAADETFSDVSAESGDGIPEQAESSEGKKKLPAEFKKRIITDLKGFQLNARGFSIIYALMMKYSDAEEFRSSLANAFQGKDEDIYTRVNDTYAAYRTSLEKA